jgi:hypothetical protein
MSVRGDGSRTLVRGIVVPLRHPGGDIDGMVILVREAGRRDGHGQQDRIALLERVGERLAGSLEIGTTLKHVAEILVPQFADHCFIDLFQGNQLLRRAMRHASDWVPPPGTWAQVGEQIHYPDAPPGSSLACLAAGEPGSRDLSEDRSSNRSGGTGRLKPLRQQPK